ncbi:MAG: amidohydrolase [Erysipelotrichaceae bacterium]|nr:amidohydrolase [Erysipelotrichaceae bacterium]
MSTVKERILKASEAVEPLALEAERYIWNHPETGYTEWQTNEYLIEKFEQLGYTPVRADHDERFGKIPGFYTDVDTGKPGPTLCIMGEMDALDIASHPESKNGMCHSCGHNAQAATMLGIAAALKHDPSILNGLCGTIRLMLVPAEEMIQLTYRSELIRKGIISYMGGKIEFMHRGYFDDVDISMMVHTSTLQGIDFDCVRGEIGFIAKVATYKGKSSHAGGSPHKGINAQYAAMLGLQACNDLRETLQEADKVRFHPIMKGVNCAVNIIPDEMVVETFVRGSNMEAIKRENKKFNRALAGGAVSIGAGLHIEDIPGYAPEYFDETFMKLAEEVCIDLVGKDRVLFEYERYGTGSSDFGDITCVMPGLQFNACGATGMGHGINYYIAEPKRAVTNSVKAQLLVMVKLLENEATNAKTIIDNYKPLYPSVKEYLASLQELILNQDIVEYEEDGNIRVHLTK